MSATPEIDWEGFARAVMEHWPDGGLDGFELQDLAFRHGLIDEAPGGFNRTYGPAEHGRTGRA